MDFVVVVVFAFSFLFFSQPKIIMVSYLIGKANVMMIQNDKYMMIVSRNAKDGDERFVGLLPQCLPCEMASHRNETF